MKKSNKLSLFYVLVTIGLFFALVGGGVYGVYISVGLNFAKSSIPNIASPREASNVALQSTVNYTPSMTGIIILSVVLILLAVFDFITMIKQIVFFKQFRLIGQSKIEKKIESNTKSKSSVIFWAFFIDIISFIAGIVGLFINSSSFAGKSNYSWVFYTVDILVSVLALLSIILLIAKLKARNTSGENIKSPNRNRAISSNKTTPKSNSGIEAKDINQLEYNLIKLESMRRSKLVSDEEYKKIRKKILILKKNNQDKNNADYWFFYPMLL